MESSYIKLLLITFICSIAGAFVFYYIIFHYNIYYGISSREALIGAGALVFSLLGAHTYLGIKKYEEKKYILIFISPIISIIVMFIASIAFAVLLMSVMDIFVSLVIYVVFFVPVTVSMLYNYLIFGRSNEKE